MIGASNMHWKRATIKYPQLVGKETNDCKTRSGEIVCPLLHEKYRSIAQYTRDATMNGTRSRFAFLTTKAAYGSRTWQKYPAMKKNKATGKLMNWRHTTPPAELWLVAWMRITAIIAIPFTKSQNIERLLVIGRQTLVM